MSDLVLPTELHDRCVAIARAALPNEACGLLGGRRDSTSDDSILVTSVHPVTNSLRSPSSFALDGPGMIAAEDRIDAEGASVIGIMHSHPTSAAVPSPRDLRDAASYDPSHVFVHLLVSMQGFAPTVRAYRYAAGGAIDLDVLRHSRSSG